MHFAVVHFLVHGQEGIGDIARETDVLSQETPVLYAEMQKMGKLSLSSMGHRPFSSRIHR